MAHRAEELESRDRFGLAGTVLDGKFQVEAAMAEGGFAVVYRATHLTLERLVAIKVLKVPADYTPSARKLFMDKFALEAKVIAKISHPAIVQVLDFGVSEMPAGGSAPWMVLEWLTGRTLEKELEGTRGERNRTPTEALALLRPVLEALAWAHDQGVAHRDIKPANIMIVSSGRASTTKLLDFGIAKMMEEGEEAGTGRTMTRNAFQAFSPRYAAPEQIAAARTGPWTDVYALGLVFTELLTDHPPYDGNNATARFADALSSTRPTPAKRGVDVGAWEAILLRAVDLTPQKRHATAGELLDALENGLLEVTQPLPPRAAGPSLRSPPQEPAAPSAPAEPPRAEARPDAAPDADEAEHDAVSRRVLVLAVVVALVLVALALGARAWLDADEAPQGPPTRVGARPAGSAVTGS